MRPRFRERQLVTAESLDAEQSFLLALQRCHRALEHSWGIVAGLRPVASGRRVEVQPGVAIDGYGRELVLATPQSLAADAFVRLGADAADLWLLYGRVADDPPEPGRRDCGRGRHGRWREAPCLRLTAAEDRLAGTRTPPGASAGGVADAPPDPAAAIWPVFLGRLERDGAGNVTVDLSERPYVGLVGDRVDHSDRSVSLRAGDEPGGFAVRDVTGERLAVDAERVAVAGGTELADDLILTAPAQGRNGLAFTELAAEPAAAMPWRIYRTRSRTLDQLRVELQHPAPSEGDARRRGLSVGYEDAAGDFVRVLTVTADCAVTVGGDVEVEGTLTRGPVGIDPDDPIFRDALLERWLRGISAAGQQLTSSFAGLEISALTLTPVVTGLKCTVRVTNTGTFPLGVVTVTATVAPASGAVLTDRAVGQPFALAPGASHQVVAEFQGLAAGTAVATARARATAPAGYPVTALRRGEAVVP